MSAAPGGSEPLRTFGVALTFVDIDGVLWTVTECDGLTVPGSRGARCLTFHSPEAVRRVWQYPAGWRDLLMPRLIALSWCR
jgi:hypothetical protein